VLASTALLSFPVLADDIDDDDEEEAAPPPPPPPLPRYQPPPPPMREVAPPPPPAPIRRVEPPPPPRAFRDDSWDSGFSLEPEVLYLRFREDFDYAETGALGGPYDSEEVDHDFDLGWRLGLGYRWQSRWDMMIRGTHLDSDDSDSATDIKGDLLTSQSFGNGTADEAFASLDTSLDYIDGEAGYTWGRPEDHQLRLLFGLRGAQFSQDAFVYYDGEDASDNEIDISNDVDAWGPRVGVEGRVYMGRGWSFLASGAVSALMADFDMRRFETDDSGATVVTDVSASDDDTIWAAEGRLGLGWLREINDWAFGIEFGYEAQFWSDIVTVVDGTRNDDLTIDGAFLRLRFLF
jgi:hypothetical protein